MEGRHAVMVERARAYGALDHVVIKGTLSDEAFGSVQPWAQFTAYLRDTLACYPELISRQALFDRVSIFERDAPRLEPNFLAVPTIALPPELVARYSPRAWVPETCGLTESDVFMQEREAIL